LKSGFSHELPDNDNAAHRQGACTGSLRSSAQPENKNKGLSTQGCFSLTFICKRLTSII
jgi:hypothetical protein